MNDDLALLRRYSDQECEESFRNLVAKHLPMVYGAALRRVGGDCHLAEDVSQHVFTELAHCATKLSAEVVVAGWLYRATGFTAAKVVRSERRRRAQEAALQEESETMNAPTHDSPPNSEALYDELDAAMDQLQETDRLAILLRFFQNQDYQTVGAALNVTDDTAQKRVSRALEKLRLLLRRRGVVVPVATLGALLAANALAIPPHDLHARILANLAGGGVALGSNIAVTNVFKQFFLSKAAWGIGIVLVILAIQVWRTAGAGPSGSPAGLVSWWSAEDSAEDRVGANHGIVEGGVSYASGRFGRAFQFDGHEGTRIKVPSSPSLSFTNGLTIEFWFRPDEDSSMGSLLAKRTLDSNATSTGNLVNYGFALGRIHPDHQYGICQFFNDPEQQGGYHARVGNVSLLESLLPDANFPALSNPFNSKENLFEQSAFFPTASRDLSVLRGRWHHLAGTFHQLDGNRVRMVAYFDGEKRNHIVLAGSLANTINDAPLSIGGFPSSPFKGRIDEIRIFNRELGAREVKALFRR